MARPGAGGAVVMGNGRPVAEPREGLRVVGIEEVHPTRSQPRKAFDDTKLDELAGSIRTQGLIQPLVVRVRETGGYEIIAGERRWRAAQRAGLHTVAVVVREIAPARAFELAMVENLQREDLNPIEEAEGFDRLIREFGYSQESLAVRVGKDRTTITNALRLLKLPPGVRGLVISGRLSMGHARAILGLESLAEGRTAAGHANAASVPGTPGAVQPAPLSPAQLAEQMESLGRRVVARELSVRQVEALVRSEKDGAAATRPQPADAAAGHGLGAGSGHTPVARAGDAGARGRGGTGPRPYRNPVRFAGPARRSAGQAAAMTAEHGRRSPPEAVAAPSLCGRARPRSCVASRCVTAA